MSTARVMVQITITDKEINEAAKELLKADAKIYKMLYAQITQLGNSLDRVHANQVRFSEKATPQLKAFRVANGTILDVIEELNNEMVSEAASANEKKISKRIDALAKKDLKKVADLYDKIGKGNEKLLATCDLVKQKDTVLTNLQSFQPRFDRNYKKEWDALYDLFKSVEKGVGLAVDFERDRKAEKMKAMDDLVVAANACKRLNASFYGDEKQACEPVMSM